MIKISHLNKYYYKNKSNEIHVINDFNLELGEKGLIALFGKSGCGKTTLLNTIGGLDKFDSGNISIDGASVSCKNDDLRNEYIGYIFQNYNLNDSVTVLENVSDALRLCGLKDEEEIRRRSIVALTNVGMEKYINRTPNNLSGGQMQRIAIARAIVKNPKIILADEPTGNLDETNTILIMNLLREIANNHLVLLVTHEADLVDKYCDKVIELGDGKIVNIRDNVISDYKETNNKNNIYLGDLEKESVDNNLVNVEYYGNTLNKVNLQIVNNNGKIYLKVLDNNVNIITDDSEVKLISGKYENIKQQEVESNKMFDLPQIENGTYGKLFNFKSSFTTGYYQNFRRKKKGKALLKICMVMFTAVLVIMTSIFGVSFKKLKEVSNAYSHNTFYVYSNYTDLYNRIMEDYNDGKLSADYASVTTNLRFYTLNFNTNYFESFNNVDNSAFKTNCVFLPNTLIKNKRVISGKVTDLNDYELVISSRVADNLLENSNVGYIKSYDDLIGLETNYYLNKLNAKCKVVGIVEDNDITIYTNPFTLACFESTQGITYLDDDIKDVVGEEFYNSISDNEAIYVSYGISSFKVNDTIQVRGVDIKIKKVLTYDDINSYGYDKMYYYNISDGLYVTKDTYIKVCSSFGNSYDINHNYDAKPLKQGSESVYDYYPTYYVRLYSNNPKKTLEYLNNNYSEANPIFKLDSFYQPNDFRESELEESRRDITSKIITMIVMFALLSLCMYFIMRSSLMIRIKQIGIYRAIGVSKKNLVFKFFIEALVLTIFTVGLSFIFISIFLWFNISRSALMKEIFYYPLWLSFALLGVLFGVCSFCGILPVLGLLRKTPSEILSKYDI